MLPGHIAVEGRDDCPQQIEALAQSVFLIACSAMAKAMGFPDARALLCFLMVQCLTCLANVHFRAWYKAHDTQP